MKDKIFSYNPLVSIVIPVYNGANYVAEAIESSLAQTYKNIEIIVVNDGSTDNTDEVVAKFKNKIIYLKQPNGGVSTALNTAIKKSKGEYVSWLSHDDMYYQDKLEKQIDLLNKLPKEKRLLTILYSNFVGVNSNGEEIDRNNYASKYPLKKLNYPYYPIFYTLINGCTLLIPKRCFIDTGFFDPELRYTQDYMLWFKMFPKYQVLFHPDFTLKSRVHELQGTRNKTPQAELEYDRLWITMIEELQNEDMSFMAGSPFKFYQDILKIMNSAGYKGAKGYLEVKMNEHIIKDSTTLIFKFKSLISKFFRKLPYYQQLLEMKEKLYQNNSKLEYLNNKISKLLLSIEKEESKQLEVLSMLEKKLTIKGNKEK